MTTNPAKAAVSSIFRIYNTRSQYNTSNNHTQFSQKAEGRLLQTTFLGSGTCSSKHRDVTADVAGQLPATCLNVPLPDLLRYPLKTLDSA